MSGAGLNLKGAAVGSSDATRSTYKDTVSSALQAAQDLLGSLGGGGGGDDDLFPTHHPSGVAAAVGSSGFGEAQAEMRFYDSDSLPSPPSSDESEDEPLDPLLDFSTQDQYTHTPGGRSQHAGTHSKGGGSSGIQHTYTRVGQFMQKEMEGGGGGGGGSTDGEQAEVGGAELFKSIVNVSRAMEGIEQIVQGVNEQTKQRELEKERERLEKLVSSEASMVATFQARPKPPPQKSHSPPPPPPQQTRSQQSPSPPSVKPQQNRSPPPLQTWSPPPPLPQQNRSLPPQQIHSKQTWSPPPLPPQQYRSPPPQQTRSPPPQQTRSPPPQQTRSPPPQQTRSPPPQQTRSPPPQQTCSPPPQQTRSPPPPPIRSPPHKQTCSPPLTSPPSGITKPPPAKFASSNTRKPTPVNSTTESRKGLPNSVHRWGVEEVGVWLKQLAPEFYASYFPTFSKHDITGAALLRLKESSLQTMGIAPYGARRQLAKEVFKLVLHQEALDLEQMMLSSVAWKPGGEEGRGKDERWGLGAGGGERRGREEEEEEEEEENEISYL